MKKAITAIFAFVIFSACSEPGGQAAENKQVKAVTITSGLDHPWGLAFLPDGRMLVTERPGNMRIVSANGIKSAPLAGVPKVFAEGQGGLLDVAVDPDFKSSNRIFFTYAEEIDGLAATAVASAKLSGNSLTDVKVIFRQSPKVKGPNHFGSRIVFANDGTLFIGLGERFEYRDKAQTLDNHFGKVVRINKDGSTPKDNPFVNKQGALPQIWSYGHRNIQGAALNPETGKLWLHEHGPRGGDEINIAEAGKNYGWPLVSYGSHYNMVPIPDTDEKRSDITYPLYHWTPSIAPSGMIFYTGNKFPDWKGSIFVGSLVDKHVVRLTVEGEKITAAEKLLPELGERVRDVSQGNDGNIYIITDEDDGKIIRLDRGQIDK